LRLLAQACGIGGGSMRRDRRLLIAILLFFGSLIAGLVQAVILRAYVAAAVLGLDLFLAILYVFYGLYYGLILILGDRFWKR
jgi:hypothetical protein